MLAQGVAWEDPRSRSRLIGAVAAAAVVAAIVPGLGAAPAGTSAAADSPVSVVVRAVPGAEQAVGRTVGRLGGAVTRQLGIIHGMQARIARSALPALAGSPGVAGVTPDAALNLAGVDPSLGYDATGDFSSLSNLSKIMDVQRSWAAGATGAGVDVAVIDSGVAPVQGLDAPGKVVYGPDLSFDSQNPATAYVDGYGHGTHMAGIIAGRDADAASPTDTTKFVGIAPDARIVSVKVASANGATDVSQVIAAIDWVVQHRNTDGYNIKVLNLSFGTSSLQPYVFDPLAFAAEAAWRNGIVVVAAVGNDGRTTPSVADPAMDPFVIAVGAEDPMGTLAVSDDVVPAFSSRGNIYRHADFVAPGAHVLSLRVPGSTLDRENPTGVVGTRFFRGSGTSQATAAVSGAAAVLLSQKPYLTPDQVKNLLTRTARTIATTKTMFAGEGVVDVYAAGQVSERPVVQTFSPANGTGSLELARLGSHVVLNGVELTGERDIMNQPWNGATWAPQSLAGTSWKGGTWNGSPWAGSGLDPNPLTSASWSSASWSSASWSSASWSSASWSSASWSSASWSSASWSSASWS